MFSERAYTCTDLYLSVFVYMCIEAVPLEALTASHVKPDSTGVGDRPHLEQRYKHLALLVY